MGSYWLKAIGHARGPLAEDWIEARAALLRSTGFPRRPRMEPGERDHPRWPWVVDIETLLLVPVLDAAPPVEAIGVAARSMSQHSHIRITAEHYGRAVEAIASVAAA